MERAAKLARLDEFRRTKPHCSASAMEAILKDVAKNGLPPLMNRANMAEARNMLGHKDTPYGKLVQHITAIDKTDNPKDVSIADPFAAVWLLCKEGAPDDAANSAASFREFFKARLLAKPPSIDAPWHLILYTDEVTPGNPLALMNGRKFHAIYWTFAELGSHALCREDSWFVVLIEFSSVVNKLHAGISQLFKLVLKRFFQRDGHNFATSGVLLEFGDVDIRLWAVVGGILQDGGAHKYVWHIRGDGATRFCVLCRNLFTESSNLVDEDGTNLLCCNVIKLDELVPMSGVDLRKNARYLASQFGRLRDWQFTELQQSMGLTYHPHALLLDRELDATLDPCKVYQHDTMHGLFVDGVVNLVMYLLFECFIKSGMTNVYAVFGEYCARWQWPSRINSHKLPEIFSADRASSHRKAKHIKCQASDLLSLMGVLDQFTRSVLMRPGITIECKRACQAFLALVTVCQLIADTVRYEIDPAQLLGSVHRFLQCFVAAFGFEHMTPKTHWTLHYAEVLEKMGRLFNCFCLERKHKVPKRFAEDIQNISKNASKSILLETLCQHFINCKQPSFDFSVGLVGGRPAPKATRELILRKFGLDDRGDAINIAKDSRINEFEVCSKGDVVVLMYEEEYVIGQVALHLDLAGRPLSLVYVWTLDHKVIGTAMSVWRTSDSAVFLDTSTLVMALEFLRFPDGTVGVVAPKRYI